MLRRRLCSLFLSHCCTCGCETLTWNVKRSPSLLCLFLFYFFCWSRMGARCGVLLSPFPFSFLFFVVSFLPSTQPAQSLSLNPRHVSPHPHLWHSTVMTPRLPSSPLRFPFTFQHPSPTFLANHYHGQVEEPHCPQPECVAWERPGAGEEDVSRLCWWAKSRFGCNPFCSHSLCPSPPAVQTTRRTATA